MSAKGTIKLDINKLQGRKPGLYAVIPSFVRYSKKLVPGAKLLYGEVTAISEYTGLCFEPNHFFANLYDTTNRTVQNWICQLVDMKFLFRVYIIDDQKNTHRVLSPYFECINEFNPEGCTKTFTLQNTPHEEIFTPTPMKKSSPPSILSNTNTITNTTIVSDIDLAIQEKNPLILQDNINGEKGNFSESIESKRRGRRIPSDWTLSTKLIKWLNTKYPTYNQPKIASLVEDFVNHWQSSARPNASKYDWDAAFRTWVNKDVEWGANQDPGPNNLAFKSPVSSPCAFCKFNEENPNETRPCPSHPLKPG